jgi:hypothetical protein
MGRLHGKKGMIYLALYPGQAAQPVAFTSEWDITYTPDFSDVTPLTGTQREWLALLDESSGDFTGFYDDATVQAYKAAVDSQPRAFILYPNTGSSAQYYSGTVLVGKFDVTGTIGDAVRFQCSWVAQGDLVFTPGAGVPAGGYTAGYEAAYT